MTFSKKLSELRKRAGLSQEQLAEMLNVSRQSVSKWESQQTLPETEKLIVLSDLFHVSLDVLLKDEYELDDLPSRPAVSEQTAPEAATRPTPRRGILLGVAALLLAAVCLLGTLTLRPGKPAAPATGSSSAQTSVSSGINRKKQMRFKQYMRGVMRHMKQTKEDPHVNAP